jgi:MFS family permease
MRNGTTAAATTQARWAIAAVFAGNGLLISSLAVRTPSLKLDLGLTPGQLGLTAALFGVSAVLAMQLAGRVAGRIGSAWILRLTTPLLPLLLVGIGVAPGFGSLAVALVALGAVHGLLDVAMNAHAVAVERTRERPIMSGCHAAWSIGAVVGSLLGFGAAQLEVARWPHYALLATVLVPVALVGGRLLMLAGRDDDGPAAARSGSRTGSRSGWTRQIVGLGAMGATVLTVEAAIANWSGVFLHERLGAPLGTAALGYAAFTACQTAIRLTGDRLRRRASATHLIRVGAATAATGLAIVVLSPWTAPAVAGFAVIGLGLALPLPVLFAVVGHLGAARADGDDGDDGDDTGDGGGAAAMLARFTTMTYAGILVAPAVIGWIVGAVGLTGTLAGLIPLLVVVAATAGVATGTRTPRWRAPRWRAPRRPALQWPLWRTRTTSSASSPRRTRVASTRRRSPSFATEPRSGTGCGTSSPRSPASV